MLGICLVLVVKIYEYCKCCDYGMRVRKAEDQPGSTDLIWCWITAIILIPVTTVTPIICSRMSSHCMAALLMNTQRWF